MRLFIRTALLWLLLPWLSAASVAATAPGASAIAPPGVPIDWYLDVPAHAEGPAIDPNKGYRLQTLGDDLYMITDNIYQAMFLVYDKGVVLIDAPQSLAAVLTKAIAEVTNRPITHVIYTHSHLDHIGGMPNVPGKPIIIAHRETRRLLARSNDRARPLPTKVFDSRYMLRVGKHCLELAYHGNGHAPGNIFVYAPKQRTLMVVDIVFPGWVPWRHFALAQDLPGYFALVEKIKTYDFDVLVSGHVKRSGTRADVDTQSEFLRDIKTAAADALRTTAIGDGVPSREAGNPWAVVDIWMDAIVGKCVAEMTSKWAHRLGGFDVFIWDHCIAMQESLQVE
jgi:glyoxylase-like metal-dependent hydrolase (beta-lactamase superfamily II)